MRDTSSDHRRVQCVAPELALAEPQLATNCCTELPGGRPNGPHAVCPGPYGHGSRSASQAGC